MPSSLPSIFGFVHLSSAGYEVFNLIMDYLLLTQRLASIYIGRNLSTGVCRSWCSVDDHSASLQNQEAGAQGYSPQKKICCLTSASIHHPSYLVIDFGPGRFSHVLRPLFHEHIMQSLRLTIHCQRMFLRRANTRNVRKHWVWVHVRDGTTSLVCVRQLKSMEVYEPPVGKSVDIDFRQPPTSRYFHPLLGLTSPYVAPSKAGMDEVTEAEAY